MHITSHMTLLTLFIVFGLLSGCAEIPATKVAAAETQSVQEVAKDAMNSKGKLSKEQVDALIRANAACRPDSQH